MTKSDATRSSWRRVDAWIWLFPILLVGALAVLRFGIVQAFRMPSGSMQPTIHVGDYMFVSKGSYGYSRYSLAPLQALAGPGRINPHLPERGDLAVFRPTPEPDRDFVKRIVGLPGDRIQMIGGVLHINGQAVRYEAAPDMTINDDGMTETFPAFRETLPNGVSYIVLNRRAEGALDDTHVYVVPPRNYFLLGDDRDNSADSRVGSVVGYVPFDNFIGRVDYIAHTESH